jgi:tRNA(fMet)-specific endonuclease VapC
LKRFTRAARGGVVLLIVHNELFTGSDWVIHALVGRSRALTVLDRLSSRHIGVSVIILAEIYQQAFESSNPDAYLATYRSFIAPFQVIPGTEPIAVRFAEIRALLTRRGELLADFDMLIAATALHYNLTVLTFNLRHFSRVPDLSLYQPD